MKIFIWNRIKTQRSIALKNNLYKISLLFLSYCTIGFLFCSCSDDAITPKKNTDDFDSARFNWRTQDISYHGFAGIWAADTSKVFLLNQYNKSLYIISGGQTDVNYVGDYYLNDIKGISNNEIYLFGQGGQKLTLIKWNGTGFEYFPTTIFPIDIFSVRGCVVSQNEIWLCSKGGIAKFDGVQMTYYAYQDSLLIPVDLFLTNDNKLQYIAERRDDTQIQESLFEFQNTNFRNIYNYAGNPNLTSTFTFLREVGKHKIGLNITQNPSLNLYSVCIDNFTGSSYTPLFCFNSKIVTSVPTTTNNPVGMNPENFIFLAESSYNGFFNPPFRSGILNWNGSIASKEIGLRYISSPDPYMSFLLFAINKDSYIILQPSSEINIDNNNTLYIGTRR